jgi:uncharacterized caspase-like protein
MFVLLFYASFCFGEDENRFALVFGNAAYDGKAALINSANDANDIADALTSIGWKVTKVINGDRKTMNKAIAEFRDNLSGTKNPTALLFYAGHGIQIGGANYLIPVKETFETSDDVVTEAISVQFILNAFEDSKVSTEIVILDACRDNPFGKKNSRTLAGTRGLSIVNNSNSAEGSAVLFSTAPGETASDGSGRNGIFTQALLKYIKSDLPLQVVITKITGEVKMMTGGKQVPYSSLSLSDEFFMVPTSLRLPPPDTVETVPLGAAKNQQPGKSSDAAMAVKAGLLIQKQALTEQKQAIQAKGRWTGWLGLGGWSTATIGAGLAGYAYYAASQALSSYNSDTVVDNITSDRNKVTSMNTLFLVGEGVGGAGLCLGIITLFLVPDTSKVDKQLQEVDHKLTQLGGN